MALTIDATVGGAASNSYATEAEATAYHEASPYGSAWTEGDAEAKKWALITATRLLDERFAWFGCPVTSAQRLLFPRFGVEKPNGYCYPSDEIPAALKNAAAEYARQLLATDRTADSDLAAVGLKRLKAGPIELEFTGTAEAKPVPDAVRSMVRHLGRFRGGAVRQLLRA